MSVLTKLALLVRRVTPSHLSRPLWLSGSSGLELLLGFCHSGGKEGRKKREGGNERERERE